MYDEDIRRKADHPNRREILVLVIACIGIHRWRDRHRRRVTQQDRVPVGCGLGDETGSDRATGTAFVLHHDLLAECRRKLVADNACHDRSAATRRKWHDQGDRSARIILGIGNTGDARETDRNQRVENGPPHRHSTFSPSFFTSPPHFLSSLSISTPYSAGVDGKGSPPSLRICSCTSGVSTIWRNSSLSRSITSFGVPAGAKRP